MKKETQVIRDQIKRSEHSEHSVPLYMTSSYVFDNPDEMAAMFSGDQEGYIYTRYSNPNVSEFISKMAKLEKAEDGWATASGMAAIFSTFGALLKAGDHILSSRAVFGSTHKLLTEILPKWRIDATYVDGSTPASWEEAIQPNTKMFYLETPTNPGLDIVDIQAASALAKKHSLILFIDNCFASPINQQPISLGADLVAHSATKYIDGQGRGVGGIVLGSTKLIDQIEAFARHTGPALSPFNAWMFSKSLETLPIRMKQHNENALEIANKLEAHAEVSWVKYPFLESHPGYSIAKSQMLGGGGLVSFELKGGLEKGKALLNKLKMISLTANLGDTRSIATHPASTTHSKLTEEERLQAGITPGLIRISVGLEHVDDIWLDLIQALA